jgi:hypothetical protein
MSNGKPQGILYVAYLIVAARCAVSTPGLLPIFSAFIRPEHNHSRKKFLPKVRIPGEGGPHHAVDKEAFCKATYQKPALDSEARSPQPSLPAAVFEDFSAAAG